MSFGAKVWQAALGISPHVVFSASVGITCFVGLELIASGDVPEDQRLLAATKSWLVIWGFVFLAMVLSAVVTHAKRVSIEAAGRLMRQVVVFYAALLLMMQASAAALGMVDQRPAINRSEMLFIFALGTFEVFRYSVLALIASSPRARSSRLLAWVGKARLQQLQWRQETFVAALLCSYGLVVLYSALLWYLRGLIPEKPEILLFAIAPLVARAGGIRLTFKMYPSLEPAQDLGPKASPELSLSTALERAAPEQSGSSYLGVDASIAPPLLAPVIKAAPDESTPEATRDDAPSPGDMLAAHKILDVTPETFAQLDDVALGEAFQQGLRRGVQLHAGCEVNNAVLLRDKEGPYWLIAVLIGDREIGYEVPIGQRDAFSLQTLNLLISTVTQALSTQRA